MNYGISKLTAKIGDTLYPLINAVEIDLNQVTVELKTKRINSPEKTIKITNAGYKGSFETLSLPLSFCVALGWIIIDSDGVAAINLTSSDPISCSLMWERESDNTRYRLENAVILQPNLAFETTNKQINLNNPKCSFTATPDFNKPEILKFTTENTSENIYNGWFS
jgi:hypothetical protein